MNRSAMAAAMATACFAITAHAQDLTVASFNVAWTGSPADFEQTVRVCSAAEVNWCNTRQEACYRAFSKAAGGSDAALLVAPCNAYRASGKPVPELKDYEQKLVSLRKTLDRLITEEKVNVFAFQEVRSQAVIRDLLGKHVDRFDSCAAAHNGFQTVGFAWDRKLAARPDPCTPEPALALQEKKDEPKRVRPGISLDLRVGGQDVTLMNVHLKSGCANIIKSIFPARLLTDADDSCRVLNRQVPVLEAWIDGVATLTPNFVVLGDFNRRLDEEAVEDNRTQPIRKDNTDPASPLAIDADGYVKTNYLWPEIADGKPQGLVQIPLGSKAKCPNEGLDYILVSEPLAAAQKGLTSKKVPFDSAKKQLIKTSDHCPRVATLYVAP